MKKPRKPRQPPEPEPALQGEILSAPDTAEARKALSDAAEYLLKTWPEKRKGLKRDDQSKGGRHAA